MLLGNNDVGYCEFIPHLMGERKKAKCQEKIAFSGKWLVGRHGNVASSKTAVPNLSSYADQQGRGRGTGGPLLT